MESSEKVEINLNQGVVSKADNKKIAEAKRLIEKNDNQQAIFLLESLVERCPNLVEALYLLGICLINEKKHLEAITYLVKAIEIQPGVADFYSKIASAYTRIGSRNLAIKNYKQALELDDSNLEALTCLGMIYYEQGDLNAAKELYSKVVKLKPSLTDAQLTYGYILSELGEYKQALTHIDKALRQTPKDSYANGVAARVHLVGGNIEEAKKYFKKAIDFDPKSGLAYYHLVSLEKIHDKDDPLIKTMEKVLKTSLSVKDRQTMHFALGEAYNNCKQPDKAFDNFSKGNRLILTSYNQKGLPILIRNTKKIFVPAMFNKFKSVGNKTASPIFIVGMPRSGSTLIDQILSSHSNVYSVGESDALLQTILPVIESNLDLKYPQCMKRLTNDSIALAATRYLEYTNKNSNSASHVVDKMLFNYLYLGVIAILFPNAKIIHSVRHPLDTSLSNFFTSFQSHGSENEWTTSLENIGFYYRQYTEMMTYWKKVLPIKILDVHYESMVGNLEEQAHKIISFCGLEWEDACLEFHKAKRSVQTASVSQVRQPIYSSSVSRWPPYAKHLAPLVEQLGDIVKDDYNQLKELGCNFKVRKKGIFKQFF